MLNICDLNIPNDGKTDVTHRIQSALDSLKDSGGTLFFPAGKYLCASLWVHNNTTIYLEAGATILASGDKDGFPVIDTSLVPGFVRGTRRGLLFALDAENITIKGEGTIDGQGHNWWRCGESDEVRPRTIQFINVNNVTIEGIHIKNSPCWTVHPIHCNNVTVSKITIENPYDSPNTDGINPESCSNVKISDCYIDVGDDCITIKSGLERDIFPKDFPCENIVVSNCTFVHGHGGIVIGSEMSGGVKNLTVTNCVFRDTQRGIRVKTRRARGGFIEDVIINNVIMDNVDAGITINEFYNCGKEPDEENVFSYIPQPVTATTPSVKNIIISNVIMKNVKAAGIYFLGLPEMPVSNIKIINADIRVSGTEQGALAVFGFGVEKSYSDGIYMKNAKDVIISDCTLSAKKEKFIFSDVSNVRINGELVNKK